MPPFVLGFQDRKYIWDLEILYHSLISCNNIGIILILYLEKRHRSFTEHQTILLLLLQQSEIYLGQFSYFRWAYFPLLLIIWIVFIIPYSKWTVFIVTYSKWTVLITTFSTLVFTLMPTSISLYFHFLLLFYGMGSPILSVLLNPNIFIINRREHYLYYVFY